MHPSIGFRNEISVFTLSEFNLMLFLLTSNRPHLATGKWWENVFDLYLWWATCHEIHTGLGQVSEYGYPHFQS